MPIKVDKYASSGDRNDNDGEVSLRHYEDNRTDIVVSGEDSHKNDIGFSLNAEDIERLKKADSKPISFQRMVDKVRQSVEIVKDIPNYSVRIKIDTGIRNRTVKVSLLDYEWMVFSFFK